MNVVPSDACFHQPTLKYSQGYGASSELRFYKVDANSIYKQVTNGKSLKNLNDKIYRSCKLFGNKSPSSHLGEVKGDLLFLKTLLIVYKSDTKKKKIDTY